MAVGSENRRDERRRRIAAEFPLSHVEAALDLLHVTDMAWHDCYGPEELALPDSVLDDVLLLADGGLVALIRLLREAVIDSRDIRMAADERRSRSRTR
ncbi:hypothetical protein FHR83_008229 [Actinoplanes campanulatus]|uniref:Uncharacterized protein n=1 Tax=Actinoplanes campanulatus TaxID=113559 RepID=A0A7W5AQR7_9ACTN|nr:hypothetical protein [Actinoplanes campanulatus]MBB3100507.1 hypothetical protein [Actinoplanes campanulatus]GGN25231.1 hypothetical protein GCM10010109_41340 [Actinoplanes campanulatus]GID39455.1 hypothetical protein Aca09nite_59610 [Actinoplanes campanulatus]